MQQETIERLLEEAQTIAVVGMTSRPSRPDHYVSAYLKDQGYRIIPVNPHEEEVLGEKAYPDLRAVPEPVDLVLLFRRPEHVPPHVEEAIDIGADAVWMQSGIVNRDAARRAQEAGLDVVMDACMMIEHRRRHAGRWR
ncbi:MAG: CoA-binding protein [Candidatus Promineifilaceae bacterium]|nr:CoA-binding protein [Candidatus Promineifilaceae bacterium]